MDTSKTREFYGIPEALECPGGPVSNESPGAPEITLNREGAVNPVLVLTSEDWAAQVRHPGRAYFLIKRLFDFLATFFLVLFLLPFFAAVMLLIYLDDRGPVFYRQTRIGRNGKPFTFYKFRSMVKNADQLKESLADRNEADGPAFKIKDDPRITKVGKFIRKTSIDELPQLLNVLKGDVSLVGPRPHLPCEVEGYKPEYYRRLAAQPGLVCLREVSGRSKLSFEKWVELDLEYLEHRSLGMDAKILLKAFKAVLKGDGAY